MIYSLIGMGLVTGAGLVTFLYYRWRLEAANAKLGTTEAARVAAVTNADAIKAALSDRLARMEAENASLAAELDVTRGHLLDVAQKLAIKDPDAAGDFLDGVLGSIAASDARRRTAAMPGKPTP
jgi:hypothetical protein